MGGGHLWARSARRSSWTALVLPAGETVQSAERWGQVRLNPDVKFWLLWRKKRHLTLSLSHKVLVAEGKCLHQSPEETPPLRLSVPHHLRQQPHHSRPRWPVLSHREARGHVGLFTPSHLPSGPQPVERVRRRWGRGTEDCVIIRFVVFTSPCLISLPDPSCGPIPRIQSGYSLLCDSVILYQCHSGFKLLGSSSVRCDPNSQQWSPAPPTCQGAKRKVDPGDEILPTKKVQSLAALEFSSESRDLNQTLRTAWPHFWNLRYKVGKLPCAEEDHVVQSKATTVTSYHQFSQLFCITVLQSLHVIRFHWKMRSHCEEPIQHARLIDLLQIWMSVRNTCLPAHKTWSASIYQVPLFAQVGSDPLMTSAAHFSQTLNKHITFKLLHRRLFPRLGCWDI